MFLRVILMERVKVWLAWIQEKIRRKKLRREMPIKKGEVLYFLC